MVGCGSSHARASKRIALWRYVAIGEVCRPAQSSLHDLLNEFGPRLQAKVRTEAWLSMPAWP